MTTSTSSNASSSASGSRAQDHDVGELAGLERAQVLAAADGDRGVARHDRDQILVREHEVQRPQLVLQRIARRPARVGAVGVRDAGLEQQPRVHGPLAGARQRVERELLAVAEQRHVRVVEVGHEHAERRDHRDVRVGDFLRRRLVELADVRRVHEDVRAGVDGRDRVDDGHGVRDAQEPRRSASSAMSFSVAAPGRRASR